MDEVDEKRIESAYYHGMSKPDTRVGMTEHVWESSRKLQEVSNEIAVSAGYQGL